jgi:uncharacterized protein with PIN domain
MPVKSRISLGRAATVAAIATMTVLTLSPRPAKALEYWLAQARDRSVPACTSAEVIDIIRDRFGIEDTRVLKLGLAITSVTRISQDYEGKNDPSPVFRRYCKADAHLNNGKTTTVYYLLEQSAGFAALSWNVDFCLYGLDPWRVNDGRCHAVRHRWW